MSEPGDPAQNHHPGVMFEIIARDQAAMMEFYRKVFGWHYEKGEEGFAYIHFGTRTLPLLGGIGQSQPDTPGLEPGHAFYIRVDRLEAAIERAISAGGRQHMEPTSADGYRFAMILDPENNPVGLVEPFGR